MTDTQRLERPCGNPIQFLIWAGDYTSSSGGCVALHRLAHNLAALGHDARLSCARTASGWLGKPFPSGCHDQANTIAVYPEIIEGNPWCCRRVVRWILNTPGFFGPGNGDGVYGERDLIMQWSADYPVDPKYKVGGLLTAFRDYSQFKDLRWRRMGTCYAVRKGKQQGHAIDQHGPYSLCIDDYAKLGGDDYLINVFNEREAFICYDTASMLPILAALCGCPTVGRPAPEVLCAQLAEMITASGPQTDAFVELCRRQW